jgi:hypothetical protein
MIARTLSVDVGPDRLDAVVQAYRDVVRPVHERADGLLAHLVLIDREAGRVMIVGVWDSAESVAAIADELEPARQRLWDAFGRRPDLDVYEVADEIGVVASSI